MSVTIYYDGECPFCTRYVRYLRIKEAAGKPSLVNLRDSPEKSRELQALGFDLDQGMVTDLDGRLYGGADAVHVLSLLSTSSGPFNRLNALLFRSKTLALVLYPGLRACRNATLFLMNRKPLREETGAERSFFILFSLLFGFFIVMHALYVLRFQAGLLTQILLLIGFALVFAPGSRRLFLLALTILAIDAWLQAPIYSNHTILKNFLVLGMLLSGLWFWIVGGRWHQFAGSFFSLGRSLLLVMYFFGIFHKINTDFINPKVSCAVTLWREMPPPLGMLDYALVHYSGIYGTFLIEGVIIILLIVPGWRHLGILAGILFHSFLALSDYLFYPTFSTISILLHGMFLAPGAAHRMVMSRELSAAHRWLRSPAGIFVLLAWLGVLFWSMWLGGNTMGALVWLVPVAGFLFLVVRYGNSPDCPPGKALLWSSPGWINVVTLAFFLNCAAPYFGLKTAQSMNMFANLHLEGGRSNHLILQDPPGPFGYLEDTVEIIDSHAAPGIPRVENGGYYLVYYDLLDQLDRNPDASISFVRDGVMHEGKRAVDLKTDIDEILHPEWFRKWFHFRPPDFSQPKPCGRT